MLGHHDHAGDPEEDDVVAGHQYGRGQIKVKRRLFIALGVGPADRGEGHHGRREPRIEHIVVLRELDAFACLLLSFLFVAGDIDVARFVVPSRNAVAPPELTRNAPILNVFKPLTINALPFLRENVDFARFDGFKTDFGDRFARITGAFAGRLAHGHVPLFREHRFDDFARAGHARHHVLMRLDVDQKAERFEVFDSGLAAFVAIHAAVLGRAVFIHVSGLVENAQHFEVVTLADFKVIKVVSRRDLHAARTEILVDIFVGDNGNFAVGERQLEHLAHQVLVAFVVGVNSNGLIAEECFRTGSGNHDAFGTIHGRVADFPHVAVFFFAFDFKIGDSRLQFRIPVDQTQALVDETFVVELDERFANDGRKLVVHREVQTLPVETVAQAAHLIENRAAGELLPLPDTFDECVAADVALVFAFLLQQTFHHDLRGDACVVGTGQPHRVVARHSVVARERIHDGLVEGVPHVKNARDVGRGQLDAERGLGRIKPRVEITALFPDGIPAFFNAGGFKALGEFFRIAHDAFRKEDFAKFICSSRRRRGSDRFSTHNKTRAQSVRWNMPRHTSGISNFY